MVKWTLDESYWAVFRERIEEPVMTEAEGEALVRKMARDGWTADAERALNGTALPPTSGEAETHGLALMTTLRLTRRVTLGDAASEALKYLDDYVGPDRAAVEVVVTQLVNRLRRMT